MSLFEDIVEIAQRAVDWDVNLILTPAQLAELLREIARLKMIEQQAIELTYPRSYTGSLN